MNRQYGLDFARLLAAYMVLFGHLVFGGTFAVDDVYRLWAGLNETLPLLGKHNQSAWVIDLYLLENWRTASAIIGVALFFLISGWVVPPMLNRYTVPQFLANRVFRIFPMLICAVLLAAGIQYQFGNRPALRWLDVVSTMSLMNEFNGHPMTLGVVWTLIIELKFYVLLAAFGRLSHAKIFCAAAVIAALSLVQFLLLKGGYYPTHPYALQLATSTIHDFYYVIFMFIGASLWLALESLPSSGKSLWRFVGPLALVLIFNINRYVAITKLGITPAQDLNLITQTIVFSLFGACLYAQRRLSDSHLAVRIIGRFSNVTYSVYLLQVSIGIFLLSRLRHFIYNQYLLLAIVIVIVTLVSAATYRFIEMPGNRFAKRFIILRKRSVLAASDPASNY